MNLKAGKTTHHFGTDTDKMIGARRHHDCSDGNLSDGANQISLPLTYNNFNSTVWHTSPTWITS
jgi:hypothetical protein